jgi:hypothetical protein
MSAAATAAGMIVLPNFNFDSPLFISRHYKRINPALRFIFDARSFILAGLCRSHAAETPKRQWPRHGGGALFKGLVQNPG